MLNPVKVLVGTLLMVAPGFNALGDQIRTAHANLPSIDRWMYANNFSGGGRPSASTFSALPVTGDDDRLAQVVIKFNTEAAGIAKGLGVTNYNPTKVVLTAFIADSFELYYDATEDARNTYGPNAVPDGDTGRPFEVYGTGFRGGFTASTFQEGSAFASGSPSQRNAYALGFSPEGTARDVTNNVTQGFDSIPWAIGKVTYVPEGATESVDLQPGESVPIYARVTFELNLSLPGVADYVKQGFNQGFIWLTLSSLHSAEIMDTSGFPGYYNKESSEQKFKQLGPSFDAEYTLPLVVAAYSHNPETNVSRIEWNGSPGFQYVVQRSGNLEAGQWINLTPVPLTTPSPLQLGFDAAGSGGRSFFRIVRTP